MLTPSPGLLCPVGAPIGALVGATKVVLTIEIGATVVDETGAGNENVDDGASVALVEGAMLDEAGAATEPIVGLVDVDEDDGAKLDDGAAVADEEAAALEDELSLLLASPTVMSDEPELSYPSVARIW